MEKAEEPPRSSRGGARRVSLPEGQRFVVTGVSLVIDPVASAVAQPPPLVHVWAEVGVGVGHEAREIGKLSLEKNENPITPVQPAVELGDGEFVLRHDSTWSTVRLYGYCINVTKSNNLIEDEGEPTTATRKTHYVYVEDTHAQEVPDEKNDMYAQEVRDEEKEGMYAEEVPGEEEEEEEEDMYAKEVPDDEEDMYAEQVLEEEEEVPVEYEPLTEEAIAERYDSDNGEFGDDNEEEEDRPPRKVGDGGEAAAESSKMKRNSIAPVDEPTRVVLPDGEFLFLEPAQFAAVKNTAGFMRIGATWAGSGSRSHEGEKEILVLYRYTRFSRTWSGVEACRRTKRHWLRFAVPAAGDMGSALAWAGSSLSPLIYPRLFCRELGDLWRSLAVNASNVITPQATRVLVLVDAGILRREDYTAERMEHVCGALEATVGEAWPEYYHVVMELHLPEPVRRGREEGRDEDGDESRPATKRRRVVAEGEECSLCMDPLESGLAAWPGCGHVFHGQCVEQTLASRATCPLCRNHLCSGAFVR